MFRSFGSWLVRRINRFFLQPNEPFTVEVLPDRSHRRVGSPLASLTEAQQAIGDLSKSESVHWAGLDLPESAANDGFLVMGNSGPGRSPVVQLFLQSVLSFDRGQKPPTRAILFDPGRKWVSLLSNLNLDAPLVILNPYDKRCCRWDIAKDVATPETARQFAESLFPETDAKGIRAVACGLLVAFQNLSGDKWNLRDLVLSLKSPCLASAILREYPETASLAAEWLEAGEESFTGALKPYLSQLSEIAAGWECANPESSFSLIDWRHQESILIAGDKADRETLLPRLYAFFAKRLADCFEEGTERERGKTWVMANAASPIVPLRDLAPLLSSEAGAGICPVLEADSLESIVSPLNQNETKQLLARLKHRCFLRAESGESAAYFASHFPELQEETFVSLPVWEPEGSSGIEGFGISAALPGGYSIFIPGSDLRRKLSDEDIYTVDFQERENPLLSPWDASDLERLSLSHLRSSLLPDARQSAIFNMANKHKDILEFPNESS